MDWTKLYYLINVTHLLWFGLVTTSLSICINNEFRCPGRCIPGSYQCDGDNDCLDWSDEAAPDCGGNCNYRPNMVQCANKLCIKKSLVCNRRNDCGDWSDEAKCPYTCGSNNFVCQNGRCIPGSKKCDRVNDCGDYSDEVIETCGVRGSCYFHYRYECDNKQCISSTYKCDGDNDCGDFSDEKYCGRLQGRCPTGTFKCDTGECIPNEWRCDEGRDCSDGSDEAKCSCMPDEYRCEIGVCIDSKRVCDSINDCSDRSDETNCTNAMGYKVECDRDHFGKDCNYDCHCNGFCHPGTGKCSGGCHAGWTGPTCQMKKIRFSQPIQRDGGEGVVTAPEAIDGDTTTCPLVSRAIPNAWLEINTTIPIPLNRMTFYNKKDVNKLRGLEHLFEKSGCTWNSNYKNIGRMDVVCKQTTKTSKIVFLVTSSPADTVAELQICEFLVGVHATDINGGEHENGHTSTTVTGLDMSLNDKSTVNLTLALSISLPIVIALTGVAFYICFWCRRKNRKNNQSASRSDNQTSAEGQAHNRRRSPVIERTNNRQPTLDSQGTSNTVFTISGENCQNDVPPPPPYFKTCLADRPPSYIVAIRMARPGNLLRIPTPQNSRLQLIRDNRAQAPVLSTAGSRIWILSSRIQNNPRP